MKTNCLCSLWGPGSAGEYTSLCPLCQGETWAMVHMWPSPLLCLGFSLFFYSCSQMRQSVEAPVLLCAAWLRIQGWECVTPASVRVRGCWEEHSAVADAWRYLILLNCMFKAFCSLLHWRLHCKSRLSLGQITPSTVAAMAICWNFNAGSTSVADGHWGSVLRN